MNTTVNGERRSAIAGKTDCDVLIDGHVHIHECFSQTSFLDAAATNFATASREIGLGGPANHVLLLCDTHAQHSFSRLLRAAKLKRTSARWSFCSKPEPGVLTAVRDDDVQLVLIAGRQIRTREGLEVLALCTTEQFPDGLGTAEAVATVHDAGAIAVLPWGFGKWLGKRAAILDQLIRREDTDRLVLGDNAGRPGVLPEPSQFRAARERGMKILSGTDPLPFPDQQHRAGGYGSDFRGPFDKDNAAQSIRSMLYEDPRQLITYGKQESPLPFFFNQLRMQLRKHHFRDWSVA
jgi:hypothetical protein